MGRTKHEITQSASISVFVLFIYLTENIHAHFLTLPFSLTQSSCQLYDLCCHSPVLLFPVLCSLRLPLPLRLCQTFKVLLAVCTFYLPFIFLVDSHSNPFARLFSMSITVMIFYWKTSRHHLKEEMRHNSLQQH